MRAPKAIGVVGLSFAFAGCQLLIATKERATPDGDLDAGAAHADGGEAAPPCASKPASCSGVDVDLCLDRSNCGACGAVCEKDGYHECSGGRCIDVRQAAWPSGPSVFEIDADTVLDRRTGLVWERGMATDAIGLAAATQRCAGRNTNGDAGWPWRVPSRIELSSLIDFGGGGDASAPFFDPDVFTTTNVANECLSALAPRPEEPCNYLFSSAAAGLQYECRSACSVRCVRRGAGVDTPRERYTFPSPDVVFDAVTGLSWQRQVANAPETGKPLFSPDEAFPFCAGRGKGWRLPTAFELATLVDETVASPKIDRAAFPDTPSDIVLYGSSTPSRDLLGLYYFVDFGTGEITHGWNAFNNPSRVRCVK